MMLGAAARSTTQAATDGSIDVIQLTQLITTLDVPVLFALFAFAIWKGWLHTPREIRKLEDDLVMWQRIALEALAVGESAVEERR